MKIGGPEPGNEVPLPVEVIEVIVASVANNQTDHRARQVNLWSLCLISRPWYTATVNWLYERPVLGTKNFDLFTRTICPPLRSPARAIGLEDLVVHLDLGDFAYITTKATTAKLLRRTRKSLQTFVAPSYSMSISSLAPISKLTALRHLDLSRDRYDFSFYELLRAIQHLNDLQILSLPRGAVNEYRGNNIMGLPSWPQSIKSLQINASVPSTPERRQMFFSDLPRNVHSLVFRYLQNWRQATILFVGHLYNTAPWITDLTLDEVAGVTLNEEAFNLIDVLDVFPALQRLSLPVTVLHFRELLIRPDPWPKSQCQEIIFHDVAFEQKLDRDVLRIALNFMAIGLPHLRKIVLPRHCETIDIPEWQRLPEADRHSYERWSPPHSVQR